jgi:hypothetical protein
MADPARLANGAVPSWQRPDRGDGPRPTQDGVLFGARTSGPFDGRDRQTTLRMSRLGLVDICEQAALDGGVNLLVVADQFEELFRYRQWVAPDLCRGRSGVREPAAGGRAHLLADLRRPDDAFGLPWRLRSFPASPRRSTAANTVPG